MRPAMTNIFRKTWAGFAFAAIGALSIALDQGADHAAAAAEAPVTFPRGYAAGVLYASVDRLDLAEYRELYAPAPAIAALKAGRPLPLGTVLTMVNYAAQRGWAGQLRTDERGRFVKGAMSAILVMEKRHATPARRPADDGVSNWRFQMFRPDSSLEPRAKERDCAVCHQKRWSDDYVFTLDEMRGVPVSRH
jgi:hypothetical protein